MIGLEGYAADVLTLLLWVIGALGTLIAALLLAMIGIGRWGGVTLLERMNKQDATLEEIKDLVTDEASIFKEQMHLHDKRLIVLEMDREHRLKSEGYGRRMSDHGHRDGQNG
jgi:hypothetical protein